MSTVKIILLRIGAIISITTLIGCGHSDEWKASQPVDLPSEPIDSGDLTQLYCPIQDENILAEICEEAKADIIEFNRIPSPFGSRGQEEAEIVEQSSLQVCGCPEIEVELCSGGRGPEPSDCFPDKDLKLNSFQQKVMLGLQGSHCALACSHHGGGSSQAYQRCYKACNRNHP